MTATLDSKTFGANRLKFTPDGKLVLISGLRNGDLIICDVASRKEFKRVKIGHGAAGILMDQVENRAFVACGPDNYVAVLDLKSLQVTGHIDVGGETGRFSLGDSSEFEIMRPWRIASVPLAPKRSTARIVTVAFHCNGLGGRAQQFRVHVQVQTPVWLIYVQFR